MIRVFADTLYWVASILPGDPWHIPALRAIVSLEDPHLVTTEEVLVEFLSAYAGRGDYFRQKAVETLRSILINVHVTVLPQTHESFIRGVELYSNRLDKSYSLVDCISMNTMRQMGLTKVLTNDHHFNQEGFIVLINR